MLSSANSASLARPAPRNNRSGRRDCGGRQVARFFPAHGSCQYIVSTQLHRLAFPTPSFTSKFNMEHVQNH